jgi:hypothetical protein
LEGRGELDIGISSLKIQVVGEQIRFLDDLVAEEAKAPMLPS